MSIVQHWKNANDVRYLACWVYSNYCTVLTKLQIILDSSENTSHTQNLEKQLKSMGRYQVINRHRDYRKAASF